MAGSVRNETFVQLIDFVQGDSAERAKSDGKIVITSVRKDIFEF